MAKTPPAPSASNPDHSWAIYRLRGTPDAKPAIAKAVEEFAIDP
jgi:hypothetical protein